MHVVVHISMERRLRFHVLLHAFCAATELTSLALLVLVSPTNLRINLGAADLNHALLLMTDTTHVLLALSSS